MGKIHIRLLKSIPAFHLVGFFDIDPQTSEQVSSEFGVKAFDSMDQLIEVVDALDIVVPTVNHFECALKAINQGKHLFIEKPISHTLEESEILVSQISSTPLIGQVGHVERFNPAFLALEDKQLNPMFIEGHRLAQYNPRGTDVSVVLDLMIHDLDILLSLIKEPVKHLSASGVAVVSDSPDIANARIEFENGAVANLTASRISMKNMRKLRLFQKDAYHSVDFLKKKAESYQMTNLPQEGVAFPPIPVEKNGEVRYLQIDQPHISEINAIKMELEEFAQAIEGKRKVRVSLKAGHQALELAHKILDEIDLRKSLMA